MRDCTAPGVIPMGDECFLTCKDGYELVGSNSVTCVPYSNESVTFASQHNNVIQDTHGSYSRYLGECRRK